MGPETSTYRILLNLGVALLHAEREVKNVLDRLGEGIGVHKHLHHVHALGLALVLPDGTLRGGQDLSQSPEALRLRVVLLGARLLVIFLCCNDLGVLWSAQVKQVPRVS